MGKVVSKIKTEEKYILECSDIYVDYNEYVMKAQKVCIYENQI